MLTSPKTSILSEIQTGKPISAKTRAFYRRRVRNLFHRLVLRAFREQEKKTGLTQKQLAERIDSSPAQINRWLGMPNNWTLNTISDLMLGMAVDLDDPSYTSIADLVAQNASTEFVPERFSEITIAVQKEKQEEPSGLLSILEAATETKIALDVLTELNKTLRKAEETGSASGSGSTASEQAPPSAGAASDGMRTLQKESGKGDLVSMEEARQRLRPKAENDDLLRRIGT